MLESWSDAIGSHPKTDRVHDLKMAQVYQPQSNSSSTTRDTPTSVAISEVGSERVRGFDLRVRLVVVA